MSALRIVTVDDETLALRRLKILLHGLQLVQHVGEASSCAEAIDVIRATSPDIVLLDIQMRDGNGFDVLESLSGMPNPPAVIFVTAFDQFAVRAFDHAVADYLLKPVERDRLAAAIMKVRTISRAQESEQRIAELKEIVRNLRQSSGDDEEENYETEFWLRGPEGRIRVPLDSVECVSSEDDYVAIYTDKGTHLLRSSLRQFESRLEPGCFVRVHRRWMVRRSAIAAIRTRGVQGATIQLRSGKSVPAGRVFLKEARRQFMLG